MAQNIDLSQKLSQKTLGFVSHKNRIRQKSKNHCKFECKDKSEIALIPTVMFDQNKSNKFSVEFVWIVRIDSHTNIGIAFECDTDNGSVNVCGIHLDKKYIFAQSQLIHPNRAQTHWHSLQSFASDITFL